MRQEIHNNFIYVPPGDHTNTKKIIGFVKFYSNPVGIYLFKVNNRNIRTICINLEQISHIVLMFPLLTLNSHIPDEKSSRMVESIETSRTLSGMDCIHTAFPLTSSSVVYLIFKNLRCGA